MKITHTVVATGHYINIHKGTQELTIRTEHGTAQELLDEAREMLTKAPAGSTEFMLFVTATPHPITF